jgi:hypothetical protein
MAFQHFDPSDDDSERRMADMLGPTTVDHTIRQAIQFAWMSAPAEKRTADQVERIIRHLVDRALKDFREDAITFGREPDEE